MSLQKLVNLPHETLIFPSIDNALANLKFAKYTPMQRSFVISLFYLESENPIVQQKLKHCEKASENGDFNLPSKLMDERFYNPFLRCAKEEYFKNITGENDPVRVFAKLRKLKDKFDEAK